MKNKFNFLSLLAVLGYLVIPQAYAIEINTTYLLSNHPDGSEAPPAYGLRLDGLMGDPSKEYTFDFDHADSSMKLIWDGNKIVIDGQAFGGEDIGNSYGVGTTAIWDIHFEYDTGISQPLGKGGVDDLIVRANNANFGTISSSLGNYELEDKSKDETKPNSLSFRFGDKKGQGHRGFDGISGWGWLNHGENCRDGDCNHVASSDWLFIAKVLGTPPNEISEPMSTLLLGIGLISFYASSRRRIKNS